MLGKPEGPAQGDGRESWVVMGVKIKLKSDCCSFRPMILLIQIVIITGCNQAVAKVGFP